MDCRRLAPRQPVDVTFETSAGALQRRRTRDIRAMHEHSCHRGSGGIRSPWVPPRARRPTPLRRATRRGYRLHAVLFLIIHYRSSDHCSLNRIRPCARAHVARGHSVSNGVIAAPYRPFVNDGNRGHDRTPIRWIRVNDLPDYVYFDHSIHVRKGIGCVSCHGRVDQMPLMWQQYSLYMKWCLECHRAPEAFVRPREHIFDMAWKPEEAQAVLGRKLVDEYNIQKRTDCFACHR